MTLSPTRRTALALLGGAAVGMPLAAAASAARPTGQPLQDGASRVYLGGYTFSPDQGVGVGTADPDTGALTVQSVVPTQSPSFLAVSPSPGSGVLYAVNESYDGGLSAFALDADGGVTSSLGTVKVGGDGPCHLALHPGGGHVFTANYNSGSVSVVALDGNGSPTGTTQVVQHTGSGPNPGRQSGPHAHQVVWQPDGDWLFAVDLGTDSVFVYGFDAAAGTLTLAQESAMPAGSGPRHLAFHPSGATAYVLGELDATLTACGYDAAAGTLTPLNSVSALPDGVGLDGVTAAEVVATSDGRFVYASVRGPDTVAVFDVADETAPRLVTTVPCGGRTPRHISLDAAENFLYVANQGSGTITMLSRDADSGELTSVGEALSFSQASCVLPAPQ